MNDSEARIERAKELCDELKAEIERFWKIEPFTLFTEEVEGIINVKVKVNSTVPNNWKVRVGEIIHHVRSALDLYIEELIVRNGSSPTKNTGFPISKNEVEFNNSISSKLEGVDDEHINIIKNLKCFPGGNNVIWKLHNLDIEDKHHKLIIAGSTHRSIIIDYAKVFGSLLKESVSVTLPIELKPADVNFPLMDGEILYTYPKNSHSNLSTPKFVFEISYSDGNIIKPEPLIQSLELFINYAEAIIKNNP